MDGCPYQQESQGIRHDTGGRTDRLMRFSMTFLAGPLIPALMTEGFPPHAGQ
jgi:hypothetical protein